MVGAWSHRYVSGCGVERYVTREFADRQLIGMLVVAVNHVDLVRVALRVENDDTTLCVCSLALQRNHGRGREDGWNLVERHGYVSVVARFYFVHLVEAWPLVGPWDIVSVVNGPFSTAARKRRRFRQHR